MSGVVAGLQALYLSALRADAGVAAALAGQAVRVYDVPPVNAPTPYYTVLVGAETPIRAEGFKLSEVIVTVDAWSLQSPPSHGEARAMIDAAEDAITALLGGQVLAVETESSLTLTDRDGRTAHGVLTLRITAKPS